MVGEVRFRSIKAEIRVLGLSNWVQDPQNRAKIIIIGVVYRGGSWLDGVMWTKIRADENDVTEMAAVMITGSPHYKQLRVIVMERLTVERSNPIHPEELFKITGLPVITLTSGQRGGKIVRQISTTGISEDDAIRIIEVSSADGITPEALRVASLIAECLTKPTSNDE